MERPSDASRTPRHRPLHILRCAGALLVLSCGTDRPIADGGACASTPESNRTLVLAFYQDGLVNRNPRSAFERYVAPEFIEHKPDVATGTRDSTVAFLERLMEELPEARWQVHRSMADGDLVFLHASFSPAPSDPSYAIADLFRVDQCRIVEHWDVVGPPAERPLNSHSRF